MTEETEVDQVTQQAERIVMLEHVIRVQGRVLDNIASEARQLKLSKSPGVSAAGEKILLMIPK